jgi:hypothetical protein
MAGEGLLPCGTQLTSSGPRAPSRAVRSQFRDGRNRHRILDKRK